ncbi:hypothetical protein Tco_0357321 [Tanacetum coccineum]
MVEDPNPPADDYKVVKAELAKIATNEALVLGENYSSTEQLNSIQQLLVFSLLTRTKIIIEDIIYSDLVTRLMAKSRQKYVSYLRFISCALEELLGSEYSQDKSFGFFPSILSKSNFSRNPSEVTPIELATFMIETVTQPKSMSQGPEAFKALPQKRKKSKTQTTSHVQTITPPKGNTQSAIKGFHSLLDEGTCKSKPFPEGKLTDAKDPGENKQPTGMGSPSTYLDDGTSKTHYNATYSAFSIDIEVRAWFLDIQLTSLSPKNCIPSEVLLHVSRQPAWSRSEKAHRHRISELLPSERLVQKILQNQYPLPDDIP